MTHEQKIIDKQKELIEHLLGAFEAQANDGLVEYHFKMGRLILELQSLESSQSEKSEPEKITNDVLDFKQYMVNLLYSAYADGQQKIESSVFGEWVEQQIDLMTEYALQFSAQSVKETEDDILLDNKEYD